jgi:two-component system, NtrC family, sensor histidine kinase PilS
MSSLNDNIRSANDRMIRMTRRLVLGRLVAVIVLFAISWLWYGQTFEISGSQLPRGPLLVFLSALTLTAVYFLLLVFGRFIAWQAAIQFVIDAAVISWLVYLTGGLTSPFITLYIVLIGITSIFLKPLGTLLVSVAAVILFVLASILPALNLIDATGPDRPLSELLQRLSFHVVAFLIVGLLAARLSERRSSGEKLEETARSLADLRALHERIVESIRSGLITTDLSGSIYTANAAATEITGLTPDELKGRSIFSLFGDISEAIRFSVEAGGGEEATPRFETDLVTPDGFAVHIGYSVSPLFSENNEAKGLIIAFQDLTEIRSMEESVRRKDRLAAVGRIGAGLAHEIRNPLGAMRGAIQVLESTTPPDSVQSDLMGIILRESDRLNSIITNFLSYARPKAGNFTETDVCEAIRDTMTLLRHSPDLKPGHKIVEDIPQEPVTIMADVTQLKQIFWNLARNALAAMPEGGELRISLTRKSSQRVRIVVADTGQGMTPEQVEQLFEPFSNSTTGGTGLGLSIVYQIIRDHNGAINVTSSEGQGTSITVELPVENIGEKAAAAKTANGDPASTLEAYLNVKGREKEISS